MIPYKRSNYGTPIQQAKLGVSATVGKSPTAAMSEDLSLLIKAGSVVWISAEKGYPEWPGKVKKWSGEELAKHL